MAVAMRAVRVTVEVACPPEAVFAFAADRRNRFRLLPDNFTGFRLLTESPDAVGARFAFTVRTDRGAYDSVTELIAREPPRRLTERTMEGDYVYETVWSFAPADGGTAVTVEMRYPLPPGVINRLLDTLIGRRALRRSLLVEALRLKQAMEGR
jgi:hypothetical protein